MSAKKYSRNEKPTNDLDDKSQTQMEHFILKQKIASEYNDIKGVQYQYKIGIANTRAFVAGSKFILKMKNDDDDDYYFVLYGTIEKMEPEPTDSKKINAKYSKYHEIIPPKLCTDEINAKIDRRKPSSARGFSIHPTSEKIYKEIIGKN